MGPHTHGYGQVRAEEVGVDEACCTGEPCHSTRTHTIANLSAPERTRTHPNAFPPVSAPCTAPLPRPSPYSTPI